MNKRIKSAVMIRFLFVILLLTSCVSHPAINPQDEQFLYPSESYLPQEFYWEHIAPGISRFDFQNSEFPIIYHAVRIDLTQPGLQIVCFPDASTLQTKNGTVQQEIPQPFIFKSITTRKFAKKYDCIIAINASNFGGKNGKWDTKAKITSTRQIAGVHKADGIIISTPRANYSVLCFKKETHEDGSSSWLAKIESTQNTKNIEEWDFAFSGFSTVLEQGIVKNFSLINHDSRSGVGISEDGTILYLLVAEGENPSKSEGLSYPQCGQIFKAMGCYNAMELDGGGSSELCINGKSILSYKNFRYQANSFGFKLN